MIQTQISVSPLHVLPDADKASKDPKARARATANDFEAVFLQNMLGHMFEGLPTDGPFHGGAGEETWRGMMVEQYAKQISKAGGIGIADAVYSEMVKIQEGARQ